MSLRIVITQLASVALAISFALPSIASADETFGSKGQIVPSGVLSYDYNGSKGYIDGNPDALSTSAWTTVAFLPELDYFISDGLALGMGAIIIVENHESTYDAEPSSSALSSLSGRNYDATILTLGLSASVGYNVSISDHWSFFPRASLSAYGRMASGTRWNDGVAEDIEYDTIYAATSNVSAPILYHPTSHFFIGFGPTWATELATTRDQLPQSEGYESTNIHLRSTVGGWF